MGKSYTESQEHSSTKATSKINKDKKADATIV